METEHHVAIISARFVPNISGLYEVFCLM